MYSVPSFNALLTCVNCYRAQLSACSQTAKTIRRNGQHLRNIFPAIFSHHTTTHRLHHHCSTALPLQSLNQGVASSPPSQTGLTIQQLPSRCSHSRIFESLQPSLFSFVPSGNQHVISSNIARSASVQTKLTTGRAGKLPSSLSSYGTLPASRALDDELDAISGASITHSQMPDISDDDTTTLPNFGILFDIDGVIVRGGQLLPQAKRAFKRLVDRRTGSYKVPILFVTNSGSMLRQKKAAQLSNLLDIEIRPEHVLMSHSPMRLFTGFHNKHVLISGQGPISEIARKLGFTKVTTVEQLSHQFPELDRVDYQRRMFPPCSKPLASYFPPIEAIILFGEPVRWETRLQLLLDVLVTHGRPGVPPTSLSMEPHLPILACNMDLLWMAETYMPRLGHGAFMHCLEELYKKITGFELQYTAMCGKPSLLTYHYAMHCLNQQAAKLGLQSQLSSVYCIGDNIHTDICGANLYDRYLAQRPKKLNARRSAHPGFPREFLFNTEPVDTCYSVLVCTGLYHRTGKEQVMASKCDETLTDQPTSTSDAAGPPLQCSPSSCQEDSSYSIIRKRIKTHILPTSTSATSSATIAPHVTSSPLPKPVHSHRDSPVDSDLLNPDYLVSNVDQAVQLIFKLEKDKASSGAKTSSRRQPATHSSSENNLLHSLD